jgi:hypothetical protein
MRVIHRKTTPKVVGGKPVRKNRWALTPSYRNTDQLVPAIDRQRPGWGYRHVLLKRDIERFIKILPDWSQLSAGLNAIVLASRIHDYEGWCSPGIVAVSSWNRDMWVERNAYYYDAHRQIFQQLGVPCEPTEEGDYLCQFTESTVRAYQLLHILLHELGHHHDRMTTKSKRECSRGETYAECYAISYANRIWDRYLNEFGMP